MSKKIEKIRHSLAHILAYAIKELYQDVKLGIGPVIENGFYYDIQFKETLKPSDLQKIEAKMKELVRQNIKFNKKLINFQKAQEIFKDQPYKLELLEDFYGKEKESARVSVYESGKFIDLCKGNHINSTKEISPDSFKLTKISGAYWKGSEKNPMLTRIYGIAFESKKELDEFIKIQIEAEKRDHRKIGEKLDLFSFHHVSPGAVFWHPKGMIIFKELEKWWRQKHDELGYQEISTPLMVKKEVFEKSGHWQHYRENMFSLQIEGETYALKPMNCPESTYIYAFKPRSYRDLPLRLSEIGRLFRNELSGVLSGLFRVRQLTMDDAHLYVREDQIQEETKKLLKIIKEFYKMFNFKPEFKLATRPENFMGEISLWNKAEKALSFALKQNKIEYGIKPKDGAFYGPKIDIHIQDALKRSWQVATIQLDFQLPERFNLYYTNEKGEKVRPVIIHRALFGSFERFIGVLIEHFGGNLPFWLSPEQIWIIPISKKQKKYAKEIYQEVNNAFEGKIRQFIKDENETISKKIREGEMQKIPYLLIIGDKEVKQKSISLRKRGKGDMGMIKIKKLIEEIKRDYYK
jgi:threonyl-tRNA synthetase